MLKLATMHVEVAVMWVSEQQYTYFNIVFEQLIVQLLLNLTVQLFAQPLSIALVLQLLLLQIVHLGVYTTKRLAASSHASTTFVTLCNVKWFRHRSTASTVSAGSKNNP